MNPPPRCTEASWCWWDPGSARFGRRSKVSARAGVGRAASTRPEHAIGVCHRQRVATRHYECDGADSRWPHAGRSAATDESGFYSLPALIQGSFAVRVTRSGYETAEATTTLAGDTHLDFPLRALPPPPFTGATFDVKVAVASNQCGISLPSSGRLVLSGTPRRLTIRVIQGREEREYPGSLESDGTFSGSTGLAGIAAERIRFPGPWRQHHQGPHPGVDRDRERKAGVASLSQRSGHRHREFLGIQLIRRSISGDARQVRQRAMAGCERRRAQTPGRSPCVGFNRAGTR